MSGDIEALGEFVTASLVADALDRPSHGEAVHHGNCANCGTALNGVFCSECGQHAHIHRTLAGVGHDFLHGITHFDSKTWKTLPMLAFRPGKLTRDYIEGKRARYIGPVPLFLLVIFLMFFVFSFVHTSPINLNINMTPARARESMVEVDKQIADLDKQIATATALPATDPSRAPTLGGLRATRSGLVVARGQFEDIEKGRQSDVQAWPELAAKTLSDNIKAGNLNVNLGGSNANKSVLHALENPSLFLYKIQSKAYKLSFLLVPLSLPWLWLLFAWRRGFGMYDHAIFALYSISFISLLFVVASTELAIGLTDGLLFGLLPFAIVPHMFAQLKGTYRLSAFGAAWRTLALSFASCITLLLYLVILLVIGLLG